MVSWYVYNLCKFVYKLFSTLINISDILNGETNSAVEFIRRHYIVGSCLFRALSSSVQGGLIEVGWLLNTVSLQSIELLEKRRH